MCISGTWKCWYEHVRSLVFYSSDYICEACAVNLRSGLRARASGIMEASRMHVHY